MQSSNALDFNITLETVPQPSFRVEKLKGMFDLRHCFQHFTGSIQLPGRWNVGVIVGRSGTGKTTIAKHLFGLYEPVLGNRAIVDEMPEVKSVEEITRTFTEVGFSSPPSWLKRFSDLSTGERMRVSLAKGLLDERDPLVFDEFTSVVDRDVAKVTSRVLQRTVRRNGGRFVAVTCHYDVIPWLEPDWVFSTDEMRMAPYTGKKSAFAYRSTEDGMRVGACLRRIII